MLRTRKWIRFYDFEVVYEINPWMGGQFANTDSCGVNDIIASAMEEHGHFGESLDLAGGPGFLKHSTGGAGSPSLSFQPDICGAKQSTQACSSLVRQY